MANTKRKSKKTIWIILVILVICALVTGFYIWHHNNKKQNAFVEQTAQTTSKLPTAQSNYTSGGKHSSSSSTNNTGGVTDNSGGLTSGTDADSGQSTSSTSGLITLESPTSNQTISSGALIYGEAQVSTVQFQLISNNTGLLAQGSLSVVNGKFSGNIHFDTYSGNGVLNVFSQDSPTTPEVNLITIPVGIK